MKALLQRVRKASVEVDGSVVGAIDTGLLVFVGIERDDDELSVRRMAQRLLSYRVFADGEGRMNLDVRAVGGGILLVSQFTLAADTRKGTRASFSSAADPAMAESLFNGLVSEVESQHDAVATGRFRADMQVSLINDGPVTFLLEA